MTACGILLLPDDVILVVLGRLGVADVVSLSRTNPYLVRLARSQLLRSLERKKIDVQLRSMRMVVDDACVLRMLYRSTHDVCLPELRCASCHGWVRELGECRRCAPWPENGTSWRARLFQSG